MTHWIPGHGVVRRIASGGQGVVYEAIQEATSRRVALKVLRAGSFAKPAEVSRFRREAELVATLNHPNIVSIFESGVSQGQPWFTMELVNGPSLLDHARSQSLDAPQRLRLFLEVCDAVAHAHHKGVIHRDIKPQNVHVDESGRVRVLDFGIARAVGWDAHTLTGAFLGTLAYASPEQVSGHVRHGDVSTDVYGLGVVLYELLTDRHPFSTDSVAELTRQVLESEPVRPSRLRPAIDADVDAIVRTTLEKLPERRYASAQLLGDDIRRYLKGEPLAARRGSALHVLRKAVQRHRWAALATTVAGAGLAGGLVAIVWSSFRVRVERDRAIEERARAENQAEASRAVATTMAQIFERTNPLKAGDRTTTIRQALDDATRSIVTQPGLKPEVKADLLDLLGRGNDALGMPSRAEELFQQSLALRRALAPPDEARLADTLELLGAVIAAQGANPIEAIALVEEALAMQRRVHGERSLPVARALASLASVLNRVGRTEDARQLLVESQSIRAALLPAEDPEIADGLCLLADLDLARGSPLDAIPRLEHALRIRRATLSPLHPALAGAAQLLARALRATGDVSRAESLQREALGGYRASLGNEHPETALAALHLGDILADAGNLVEAEIILRDASDVQVALLGEEHPQRIPTLVALAGVLRRQGRPADASRLEAEAERLRAVGELVESLRARDVTVPISATDVSLDSVVDHETSR